MTTAREFYAGQDEPEAGGVRFAKAVVWYDQRTPLFVCEACVEHVRALRFEGDATAADHDERRARAYHRLLNDDPECDACSGRLAEKVEL